MKLILSLEDFGITTIEFVSFNFENFHQFNIRGDIFETFSSSELKNIQSVSECDRFESLIFFTVRLIIPLAFWIFLHCFEKIRNASKTFLYSILDVLKVESIAFGEQNIF